MTSLSRLYIYFMYIYTEIWDVSYADMSKMPRSRQPFTISAHSICFFVKSLFLKQFFVKNEMVILWDQFYEAWIFCGEIFEFWNNFLEHLEHISVNNLNFYGSTLMCKFYDTSPQHCLQSTSSTYLKAALSQASGVSTAGKFSVVKSTFSKSPKLEVGCIFNRFSINEQIPLLILDCWLSDENVYCSNCWLSVVDADVKYSDWGCGDFFPLSRRTIVNPLSAMKIEKEKKRKRWKNIEIKISFATKINSMKEKENSSVMTWKM